MKALAPWTEPWQHFRTEIWEPGRPCAAHAAERGRRPAADAQASAQAASRAAAEDLVQVVARCWQDAYPQLVARLQFTQAA